MTTRLLPRLFFATIFVAACALSMGASAQFSSKSSHTGSSTVTTPHVQAELLAHAPQGVVPGQPLWVGLQITHQPDWHTYWKNPGDSGLPTELTWQMPAGLDVGDIAWPVPHKIAIGNLANYGYEGTVLLPVPVTVSSTFAPGPLAKEITIQLRASWLVCRKECIPEEGEFTLQLPVRSTTALHGALFEQALKAQPDPLPPAPPGSAREARIDGDALQVRVPGLPAALRGKVLDLYPETPEVIHNAAPWPQQWDGDVWTARIPLAEQRSNSPANLPVVLAERMERADASTARPGYRTELPVAGSWPAAATKAGLSPALEAALQANAANAANASQTGAAANGASSITLAAALLGALLGGLLLNLMPCVFPVLAIKVVGFTRHAQDRRAHRVSGLAYTAGVVVSFLALGAVMLGLRAAGEAVGWGFQLQSPAVVAALAGLFTLTGLNLAGVFEFGQMLPSSVTSLQARHPVADSFLTGVLAVAVASPCTAPFMGASMGLTATLPAAQALAVFAALGIGLALPYLAASLWPAVACALPRPGAWMDTFKRFMAFPMFATVVWLVWVLGQQSGIDGAAALLILLVGLGLLAWSLALQGRARRWMGSVAAVSMALLLWAFTPHVTRMAEVDASPTSQTSGTANAPQSWQPWAPDAVAQLTTSGRPVFVDFTAAWCVTCQYNKKTTLANAEVLADLQAKNVALLRADWTRRDPRITAALAELGRNGVPVYVLHAPGRPPVVFSEVLGERELRDAVAKL